MARLLEGPALYKMPSSMAIFQLIPISLYRFEKHQTRNPLYKPRGPGSYILSALSNLPNSKRPNSFFHPAHIIQSIGSRILKLKEYIMNLVNPAPQRERSFFELPLEIRRMIYGDLLVLNRGITSCPEIAGTIKELLPLHVLTLNSTFHNEAVEEFLNENIWIRFRVADLAVTGGFVHLPEGGNGGYLQPWVSPEWCLAEEIIHNRLTLDICLAPTAEIEEENPFLTNYNTDILFAYNERRYDMLWFLIRQIEACVGQPCGLQLSFYQESSKWARNPKAQSMLLEPLSSALHFRSVRVNGYLGEGGYHYGGRPLPQSPRLAAMALVDAIENAKRKADLVYSLGDFTWARHLYDCAKETLLLGDITAMVRDLPIGEDQRLAKLSDDINLDTVRSIARMDFVSPREYIALLEEQVRFVTERNLEAGEYEHLKNWHHALGLVYLRLGFMFTLNGFVNRPANVHCVRLAMDHFIISSARSLSMLQVFIRVINISRQMREIH